MLEFPAPAVFTGGRVMTDEFGGAVLQARPDGSVTLAAVDSSQPRAQLVVTEDGTAALQVVGRPGGGAVQVP